MTFLPVNENTADADNLRKFWEQCKSDSTGKKLNVSESSGTETYKFCLMRIRGRISHTWLVESGIIEFTA